MPPNRNPRARRPLADRFWEKVGKTDGCWLWTGTRHPKGYGYISEGGREGSDLRAPRVAWMLTYGTIPDGLWVRHKCDNPPCVRPDHLLLGTAPQNSHDMVERGRVSHAPNPPESIARGDRHGSRLHPERVARGETKHLKLTESKVREIRQRVASGEEQKAIAAEFGVSRGVISEVCSRKSWAHVT